MLACSLALVLLMDVSGSVSPESYELQRDGTAEAFRSPEIARTIEGQPGGIAVTAIEWGNQQHVTVSWRVLRSEVDAQGFARDLAATSRMGSGGTYLGSALRKANEVLEAAPCQAEREVVDVSGDGASTEGDDIEAPRAELHARGATINGLPIVTRAEPQVADYYRQHVVSPNGQTIVAEGWTDFRRAIRSKIVWEIAAR